MPEYHDYNWIKVILSNGFNFYMRDKFFDERIINQMGQYGLRWIPKSELFIVHNETDQKITLKLDENKGFNPAMIVYTDRIKKEVEVLK